MKKPVILLLVLLGLTNELYSQNQAPLHAIFHQLLKKNVSASGKVNYRGFIRDSVEFNRYLRLLRQTPPNEKTWTREEQMAYWINAYNAFTIQLIMQYYPVKSIKDIGSTLQIPFVNTPWDIVFITIGQQKFDLNNIEHDILRKKFDEPRIHMALVCASKSCPVLLNEAYDPARLNTQLTTQTKAFLNDPSRNKISPDKPQVSKIFSWYSGDFEKQGGSVKKFINHYSAVKINEKARLDYLDYDWSLNE